MTKKHLFVFDFWFGELSRGERHELPIEGYNTDVHLDAIYDELNSRDLETTYGIHDWSTTGGRADGAIEDIGFTTYEVAPKEVGALLIIWQDILTNAGIKITGPWEITKYEGGMKEKIDTLTRGTSFRELGSLCWTAICLRFPD
jgi:hypothetical protein